MAEINMKVKITLVFCFLLANSANIRRTFALVPLQDFFPFGSGSGDVQMPSGDDGFEVVSLRYPFPFFNETYTQLFVNMNGAISFKEGNTCKNYNYTYNLQNRRPKSLIFK